MTMTIVNFVLFVVFALGGVYVVKGQLKSFPNSRGLVITIIAVSAVVGAAIAHYEIYALAAVVFLPLLWKFRNDTVALGMLVVIMVIVALMVWDIQGMTNLWDAIVRHHNAAELK